MRKRVHDKSWWEFVRWCRARKLRPMPANPWTIAAYLRWCERHRRKHDAVKTVKTIGRAHLLNCLKSPDQHPMVLETLRIIEQRSHTKASRTDLFRDEDFVEEAVEEVPESPEPPEEIIAKRPRRMMRATPKLVSRRR